MSDKPWYADLGQHGLQKLLGIEIVEMSAERVVATMPVDERTHQPFGILHGGASIALAETVASLGAANRIDREQFIAVWSIEIRDEAGKLVCISRCTMAIVPRQ